jgi:hypothetical protein
MWGMFYKWSERKKKLYKAKKRRDSGWTIEWVKRRKKTSLYVTNL